MSPALAGGFLTIAPPGKPDCKHFKKLEIQLKESDLYLNYLASQACFFFFNLFIFGCVGSLLLCMGFL